MEGRRNAMHEQDEPEVPELPEVQSCFFLIIQGTTSYAGVVEGIDGVKDALIRTLCRDPEHAGLGEVAALLASLDDPAAWLAHGTGDGRPYWHWWVGFEG